MKICRMLFIVLFILLWFSALIVVGCGKDYTGELRPDRDCVEETLDALAEDEWDTMIVLPPLPYAPPPDLTNSDSILCGEEPRQPEQRD